MDICVLFKMFNAKCYCGKINFYRNYVVKTWIHRKCKICDSNVIVYKNDIELLNFNNKKERYMNSYKRKNNQTHNEIKRPVEIKKPIAIQTMPIVQMPIFTAFSPIINNVFMGYESDYVIVPILQKSLEYDENKNMDIDMKSEFDEYYN